MKKTIMIAVGIVILVALIVGAGILYSKLSEKYSGNDGPLVTIAPDKEDKTENTTEAFNEETTEAVTETPKLPFEAADFTVYDMNGNAVKLSDMAGKVIVVNYWATWCTYCKMEMPEFQEMYDKYGDEVVFMMINYQESKSVVKSYIDKEGYSFPVYMDTSGLAAALYGVTAFPTTYFFSEDGSFTAYATGAINTSIIEQGIDMVKGK